VCSANEDAMVDWEGNITDKKDGGQVLLSEVPEDPSMSIAAAISRMEATAIDETLKDVPLPAPEEALPQMPNEVSPICDVTRLCMALEAKCHESLFKVSVGATTVSDGEFLVECGDDDDDDSVPPPELKERDDFSDDLDSDDDRDDMSVESDTSESDDQEKVADAGTLGLRQDTQRKGRRRPG